MDIVGLMRWMPEFIKRPYFDRLQNKRLNSPVTGNVAWEEIAITSARHMGMHGEAAETAANDAADAARMLQADGATLGRILDFMKAKLESHMAASTWT